MNERTIYKDYLLLKSSLDVPKDIYEKFKYWDKVASIWLEKNSTLEKQRALRIFINEFLMRIPESNVDINDFFKIDLNLIDINKLLEDLLLNLSDKNKKYYKNYIINFVGEISKERGVVNIFFQSYLFKWVKNNFSREWVDDLKYIFEWNNIEEQVLIQFVEEVYGFIARLNNYKNIKDLLCDERVSISCLKNYFKKKIECKVNISKRRKILYIRKFSELIDWIIKNYFCDLENILEEDEGNISEPSDFLIKKFGKDWGGIQVILNNWLFINKKSSGKYRVSLRIFFYNMFSEGDTALKFYEMFSYGVNIDLINLMKIGNKCNDKQLRIQCAHIIKFSDWYVDIGGKENCLVNPFISFETKNPFYKFLIKNGFEWNDWLVNANYWLLDEPVGRKSKIHALLIFLNYYEKKDKLFSNINYFIENVKCENIKYSTILDVVRERSDLNINYLYYSKVICDFVNWIAKKRDLDLQLIKIDTRNFGWILIDYGKEWSEWVVLAERWLETSGGDLSHKKQAIKLFFINYLIQTPTNGKVELLFKGTPSWTLTKQDFFQKLVKNSNAAAKLRREYYTSIVSFFDWIISEVFSDTILNPINKKDFRNNDPIYLLILDLGHEWCEYGKWLNRWLEDNPKLPLKKLISPMKTFFNYLKVVKKNNGKIENLLDLNLNKGNLNREKYSTYLKSIGYTVNSIRFYIKWPSKFFDYLVSQINGKNYINPLAVTVRTEDLRKWFTHIYGTKWETWCTYAEKWLSNFENRIIRTSIIMFFENYLLKRPCNSNIEYFFHGLDGWFASKDDLRDAFKIYTNVTFKTYFHYINKFTYWVFNRYFFELRHDNIVPPFGRVIRNLKKETHKFLWFISEYGTEWSEWANLANDWILSSHLGQSRRITSLSRFFEYYLVSFKNGYVIDNVFYSKSDVFIDKNLFSKILSISKGSQSVQSVIVDCLKFFDWIIKEKYKDIQVKLVNPFGQFRYKDGRTKDIEFKWIITLYGQQWESWRALIAEWISTQSGSLSTKMRSISIFIESYLALTHPEAHKIEDFFSGNLSFHPTNDDLLNVITSHTTITKEIKINTVINHIVVFIDWSLLNHFLIENTHGFLIPKYINPFDKEKSFKVLNESVYNPLPYNYIRALLKKLCPVDYGSFKDWHWAFSFLDNKTGGGWFDIPIESIDFNDPDCVWRKITTKGRYPVKYVEKYQMWSPVAALGVFLKLHLPLRTYQTRMLDSGEADDARYEEGKWVKNLNKFVVPNLSQGVFKKITEYKDNEIYTGLYINTNKTADINKLPSEKGYVIPWQNQIVLYWLEKLRNWQEKYNKISSPTPCISLTSSHLGQVVADETLRDMGNISFLLRHAAAKKKEDRVKPILDSTLNGFWLRLLKSFEDDVAREGQTFSDGSRIKFVEVSPNSARLKYYPLFPLHSLRVSFITSYLQDGKVPLPIVSKLLAGHSSLLMTLYYTKISPHHMQTIISDAQNKMEQNGNEDLRLFLRDRDINEIQKKMVFQDSSAIAAILKIRNILGWEQKHHGICLAAGNTLDIRDSYESTKNAGCWNGGKSSEIEGKNQALNVFEPVPHGAGNCVRCRWFITHASYLPQLVAHFNILSFKANLSATAARKANDIVISLENQKQHCIREGKVFTEAKELERLLKEYKLELTEADEYCKDIIATLNIIERINIQEKNRDSCDENQKVIAVGDEQDVEFAFLETKSELLHLCVLCDDAEIYPDLYNKLNKTPAIERRTRLISKMMLKKGYQPLHLFLSEEEQFKVINSMIREMAKHMNKADRFDSFRLLIDRLEKESLGSVKGVLEEYMDENKNKYIKLINMKNVDED